VISDRTSVTKMDQSLEDFRPQAVVPTGGRIVDGNRTAEVNAAFGMLAEFEDVDDFVSAATRLRVDGYQRVTGYSPFPVDEIGALFPARTRSLMAPIVFFGGFFGGTGAFFMEWYANVVSYPLNVGGRPYDSWPAFIPITFELTVLCAAIAGCLGLLFLNRLPALYHPTFNDPRFLRATQDRFFLCVESRDRKYDRVKTRALLESLSKWPVTEARW
jgi:hypothetical protein